MAHQAISGNLPHFGGTSAAFRGEFGDSRADSMLATEPL